MLTPSVILLVIGTFMLPGGVFAQAPAAVSVTVIVAGSLFVVLGAMLGFVKIIWTDVTLGPVKGVFDTRDSEFKQFFREHRERLLRFTTLMSGDPPTAEALLVDASAQTRLAWATGASADPLGATLRTLLHWIENPALWRLFRNRPRRRRRRWGERTGVDEHADPATTQELAALPFRPRAALLLDALLGIDATQIAALLGGTEDDVKRDVEAALRQMRGGR